MAKQSGLGDNITVDDSGGSAQDISTDITNYSIGNSQNLQTITGLDKSAIERLILLADGEVTLNGIFDAGSNLAHDVFKTRTGTRTVQIDIGGSTSGYPRLSMEMLVENYNLTRGNDGALTWASTLRLQSGTVPAWSTVP